MASQLANFIENSPDARFQPEKGRYHLYVALSCPFACRVLTVINLKGLQDYVDITVVHPVMQRTRPDDSEDTHTGWAFVDATTTPYLPGPTGLGQYTSTSCSLDPLHGARFVRDLYERVTHEPVKYSVPLLWDKRHDTIVSTESADMMRMFNSAFEGVHPTTMDLYPEALRSEIDDVNAWVGASVIFGVYKVGLAPDQAAYDAAITNLYDGLDRVEARLAQHRYLVGNTLTEADLRLFVALIRFDVAYATIYKLTKKLIREYPNMSNYVRDIYQLRGIQETVDFEHIKACYFGAQVKLNPLGLVPASPDLDYTAPHDRARFE